MKRTLLKTLAALATLPLLTAASLQAADADKPARPNREEIMKQFDANGDGQLDQAERQAVREHMQAMRPAGAGGGRGQGGGPGQREGRPGGGRGLAQFDTDGDGQLNAAEREAAAATMREHVVNNPRAMERFDLDGDGALSDDEWNKARDEVGERMGGGRGGRGPGGGQGGPRGKKSDG